MKLLTKSEKVAKSWLEQRYDNVEKVEEAGEPDFIADGKKFEAKKPHNNQIHITEKQSESFPKINPTILVVEENSVNPMRYNEVEEGGDYNIHRLAQKKEALRVYICGEEKKEIGEKAEQRNRSISDYLRLKGLEEI